MRKHGKSFVFYAVIYSAILFSGGCVCPDCHAIKELQDRIMTPSGFTVPAPERPVEDKWIVPQTSGYEEGPIS